MASPSTTSGSVACDYRNPGDNYQLFRVAIDTGMVDQLIDRSGS